MWVSKGVCFGRLAGFSSKRRVLVNGGSLLEREQCGLCYEAVGRLVIWRRVRIFEIAVTWIKISKLKKIEGRTRRQIS